MIILDYKDKRPLYEQIVSKISDLIIRGVLKENDRLPSVRSLAVDLSINPNTISRAYSEMENKGFVYNLQGKGCFVADIGSVIAANIKAMYDELEEIVKKAGLMGIEQSEFMEKVSSMFENGKESKDD